MTENQETDGADLASMGVDGAKWATEFATSAQDCRDAKGIADPFGALRTILDPSPGGWLHAWFANAIEAGRSVGAAGADRFLAQLEANEFWPPLGSYHWRCAEALLKITRRDEWRSWGLRRQGEEITKLAAALAQVIPDSDVSRYVRERLLVAETTAGA